MKNHLMLLPNNRVSILEFVGISGPEQIRQLLVGEPCYFKTDFLVLPGSNGHWFLQIHKKIDDVFSKIESVQVLADPGHTKYVKCPTVDTDLGKSE